MGDPAGDTDGPTVDTRTSSLRKRKTMTKFISKFVQDESGATAIEYGLIAALIAVVIISAVTTLGTTISSKFQAVTDRHGRHRRLSRDR
jgi:pilus assembly protein Flp/PilA